MSYRGSHVQIDSLSHRYGSRGERVLDDLSLTILPGQCVALIGRSGCGKSTLLQLIAGMIRTTAGTIHIDGTLVREPSPRWNMMFQKPLLYPWMTVQKNAALGTLIAGKGRAARQRVTELLDLVGMADYANVNVQRLSGGQQQRVALARSLATQPELLMLDEPFAALDEITRHALRDDVRKIAQKFEMTLVLVTHDIDEAVAMANRIIVMSSGPGRVVADLTNESDDPESVKQQIRFYLGDQEDHPNGKLELGAGRACATTS